MNQNDNRRGFAGLSSLVSNIEDGGAAKKTTKAGTPGAAAGRSESTPQDAPSAKGGQDTATPPGLKLTPSMPDVTARSASRVFLADDRYTLLLVRDVPPIGERQGANPLGLRYPFVLVAVDKATAVPACFVTLESNALGSTFLCMFPRAGGHANFGDGDAYATELAFLEKSLPLMKGELGVSVIEEIQQQGSAVPRQASATVGAAGGENKGGGETGGRRKGKGVPWGLVLLGVVFLVMVVFNNRPQQPAPTASSYVPGSPPSTATTSRPATQPSAPAPSFSEEPSVAVPPVGTNVILSSEQIRWCLREEIRIEAKRPLAVAGATLAYFNKAVDDYNARCGSFRYRRGALESARSDVENVRAMIIAQARAEVTGGPVVASPTYTPRSTPTPQPDIQAAPARTLRSVDREVVRHVQTILSDLGYDPGPADGVVGRRTREAVKAYQRDRGLTADGEISPALVDSLAVSNIGLRYGGW